MDNASKKAALKELRQLYGYDMAVVKQNGTDIGDETSELESLALYNLNKRIVEAITEFSSYVRLNASITTSPYLGSRSILTHPSFFIHQQPRFNLIIPTIVV